MTESHNVRSAARQHQFLDVVERDVAVERFQRHLALEPLGVERTLLADCLDRVLAEDIAAAVDVSGFDRSNVDGFAVQSADTYGAMEERPMTVSLNADVLAPGIPPRQNVSPGTATTIATGGMLPRGADAVVMVEDTDLIERSSVDDGSVDDGDRLQITRAIAPGGNVTFAGTDIAKGETVLRAGRLLTSREIGVLAAIGCCEANVFRRPKIAVISTGNEIVPPGEERPPGFVYDSNLAIISAAVRELGGLPVPLGVVRDDEKQLQDFLEKGLAYDGVVLSGGTSKGAGDLTYRVVSRLKNPGIVVHGVALKPGKPICLAVTHGKPVVVLPGFPTSAIFTFHEFVAPVIRALAGRKTQSREWVSARLPVRVNSDRGRTEYLLVGLVNATEGLAAYPMGKGSGSVTTFSGADGFLSIDSQTEILESGTTVKVHLLSEQLEIPDFVAIGSHCVGLDFLLGELERRGWTTKSLSVGSTGGLAAVQRGECDVAGVHLLDPETGEYNRPFLTPGLELIPGYGRMQGFVFRPDDERFSLKTLDDAVAIAIADPDCRMINRNPGSGTRILIDGLLENQQPPGYAVQAKSHNAVAAAIQQSRADWGVAIDTVARDYGLSFLPVCEERYDFVVAKSRLKRDAVKAFRELLETESVRRELSRRGFLIS